MSTLICGSLAYDTIMVYPGRFKEQILPEQLHILNVSFLVPEMRREFGGCAGNIAYNLHMLGGSAVIMAAIGLADGAPYLARLDALKLSRRHIREIDGAFTGQAFIMTDMDDNQITAFHPGAMGESHRNHVGDATGVSLGIVAPDGRDGMMSHAKQFAENGIPFIFDPGQGMPMFSGPELLNFVDQAAYVAVNDYEAKMLQDKTGKTIEELAHKKQALIVTLGAQGAEIYADGQRHVIPSVIAQKVQDPTGCGDAFRGGLLYGMAQGMDWPTTGRLASLMGSLKIAERGAQNHVHTREEIGQRFFEAFGNRVW